jgi:regulation of enolase protein 1 (concanavalin A-like superfamily)
MRTGMTDDEAVHIQVERHQEQLRIQREDLDELRKMMEENARITIDFKAELSEIR